jgi:transposase
MERTVSSNIVPKRYHESFKRQVVEMVVHGDRSVLEVAKELGVSDYSIYQWKKKYFSAPGSRKAGGETAAANGLPESVEELQKLVREQQRQIDYLRQQREVLKKTLGIICEGPSNATGGSSR